MNPSIRKYMAEIGSKGGSKSRRVLTPEQAKAMAAAKKDKRNIRVAAELADQERRSAQELGVYGL